MLDRPGEKERLMKRVLISLLVLTLASSVAFAQNSNAKGAKTAKPKKPTCAETTEAQITDSVKAKIAAAPSLKDQSINVSSSGRVVTLTGKVKNSAEKGVATKAARSVACVKKVDNKLEAEKKATPPKPAPTKNAKPKNSK